RPRERGALGRLGHAIPGRRAGELPSDAGARDLAVAADGDGDVGHARHLVLVEAGTHARLDLAHATDDIALAERFGQARVVAAARRGRLFARRRLARRR